MTDTDAPIGGGKAPATGAREKSVEDRGERDLRGVSPRVRGEEAVWDTPPPAVHPAFGIEDRPGSWWESLLYGWQHTLVDISPFVLPLAVASAIGMPQESWAAFINYGLFAMGIATLLQTTIGNRLPIIQGPSATLTGTLAPLGHALGAPAMWGGVLVGGVAEMLIGASGVLRSLRRLFPAAVSGVVVISIGLSLGQLAVRLSVGDGSGRNFALAALVIACVFALQIGLPRAFGGLLARGSIFFSIWLVGLGVGSALGLMDWAAVGAKPWLALPALFPFGGPGFGWQFTAAAALGAFAGYVGSMVESIGDYAATCAVAGETFRVRHMNRGIFAEGLGCVVASAFGGLPVTSYTQNIGIIATTRVASRHVVQVAAVILMLYGLSPRFGALLVAMPRPVLGGVFVIVCGMIVMSGIRLLHAAPATTANSLVIGTTLVGAIGIPFYVRSGLGEVWLAGLPAMGRLLLTNTVVLAVVLGVGLNLALNVWLGGWDADPT